MNVVAFGTTGHGIAGDPAVAFDKAPERVVGWSRNGEVLVDQLFFIETIAVTKIGLVVKPSSVVSVGILISGKSAATVNTMNMKLLLKSLTLVVVSILVAGVFHVGWLAAFIPMAKSGVMALKIFGWTAAPVATALGYAAGLWMSERLLTQRTTDFLRILVWPLVGCSLGATALCWIGPMWAGIGTVVGGAASVVLREVKWLRCTCCHPD